MNVFAGQKSGMQSMFESILPPDVLEAIKIAKEQLPQVIALVQASVARIEGKLDMVNDKTTLLLRKVESIRLDADTNAVPDVLPSQIFEVNQQQLDGEKQLQNGDIKHVRSGG